MKNSIHSFPRLFSYTIILVCFSFSLFTSARAAENSKLVGLWEGKLKFGFAELRLIAKISQSADGSLKAAIDSPDQGAKDIPVDSVVVDGNNVRLFLARLMASFIGKIRFDTLMLEGTWNQGGLSLPLSLKYTEKVIEAARPQEPKKPYPYKEEEVVIKNDKAGVSLAGTLTFPSTGGSFPAVLLVSGSGAQDRDETIFGHKPFLVLSDYLTRNGVAVLRCDDRGTGKSTGNFSTGTTEDFAGDALACVRYLAARPEINNMCIGLIGHSEGGIIAPMAANQSNDIAFIILMAGPGLTGEQILILQMELISRAEGVNDSVITQNLILQKKVFSLMKEERDTTLLKAKLHTIMMESVAAENKTDSSSNEAINKGIEMQIRQITSPWFRFFLTYDPAPALRSLRCPVLALNGEKDLQVPSKQNLKAIEDALKKSASKKYRTYEFPGLNHLFQTAKTGGVSEYGKIEETISPNVLGMIGTWIKETTGAR